MSGESAIDGAWRGARKTAALAKAERLIAPLSRVLQGVDPSDKIEVTRAVTGLLRESDIPLAEFVVSQGLYVGTADGVAAERNIGALLNLLSLLREDARSHQDKFTGESRGIIPYLSSLADLLDDSLRAMGVKEAREYPRY